MTRRSADVVLGGRYRLIEARARGGMGTVWLAEDETLGRRVAVKVLNDGLADDPRFIERFRREARAAAGLSHPHVAGVFDYGEEGSRPYIVMELVDGETLAERLERSGPLAAAEAATLGAEIADALAEAHDAGVVHRDVKPANIMLTARGVKVMDFGIAASGSASNLTAAGMVMGTARYLSPEQARGDRATPASDVYALGVVLYEALSGAAPFDRDTPVATATAHVHEAPRPLRDVRPDVPSGLAALVDACLRKDADQRPAPASALADSLRRAAGLPASVSVPEDGDAPTTALDRHPTAVLPPATRLSPRRRAALTWMIPLLLALVGLAAFFLISRMSNDGDPAPVRVPDFSGLGRAQAEAEAEKRGIEVTFRETESDERRGRVFDQIPPPSTLYAPGSTVVLLLSTGPELVTVPSLDGVTSPQDVEARIEGAGLVLAGFELVEGEPGIVETNPPAGSRVEPGTPVTVYYAEGPADDGGEGDGRGNGGGDGKGKDKDDD